MLALPELSRLADGRRTRSWSGRRRLAGWVTITTVAWAELWVCNLAKEKRQSSGQISQARCRVCWLPRPKATMAKAEAWEVGSALSGWVAVWIDEGGRSRSTAGTTLAGEKESFQAGRGGAVSYP